MWQFSFSIQWTIFRPGVVAFLLLGLIACGVGKHLAGVDNNVELRRAMEKTGKERIAWQMAKKLDSFDAYCTYFKVFPEGEYASDARAHLETYEAQLWEEVRWAIDNEKRISDYLLVKYLDFYPDSEKVVEARAQLRAFPEWTRWYTGAFYSYDAAFEVLEPVVTPSVHINRLLGLASYLDDFPQGLMREFVTERLALTYTGYEMLPERGRSVEEEIDLDAGKIEEWASALSGGLGLDQTVADRSAAYLREILQGRNRLNTLDLDHNSIPDELEPPGQAGPEGPFIDYMPPEAVGEQPPEEIEVLPEEMRTDPEEEEMPVEMMPGTPEAASPEDIIPGETTGSDPELALSLEAMAERTAQSISQGQFLYDSIPPLVVDEDFFFQLMIISSTGQVSMGVRRGRVSPRQIPVTSEMVVNISPADPNAFSINSLSAAHQPVFPGDTTVWSWRIIPLKSGTHRVAITIDIVTTGLTSGEPLKKNITVFNEKVQVKAIEKPAEPVADNTGAERGAGFGFYPWLLLLLPVGALGFFLVKRRRQDEETAPGFGQPFGKETPEQRAFLLSNNVAILELLNKAERAVAKGDTRRALEELEAFFDDHHYAIHQQLVTLAAQFSKYQREFNLGLKPDDSIPNRVNMALLELINRIHEVVDQV